MLMKSIDYFAPRLCCTDAEKDSCLETVVEVLSLWKLIRKEGLLALGWSDESKDKDPFFRACLLDASDMIGMDNEPLMESLFMKYLVAGDYKGADFLRNIVIAEGILLIPRVGTVDMVMPGFRKWGEELSLAVRGYFGVDYREKVEKTILRQVQLYEKSVRKDSLVPEFDALSELSQELCARLWQEVPERTMEVALMYAGEAVWDRIMSALSPEEMERQMDEMEWFSFLRQTDVEAAQREIIEKAASYQS